MPWPPLFHEQLKPIEQETMTHIRAIGFDLFNTLITVEPQTLQEAHGRLFSSLIDNGFALEEDAFKKAHRQAALEHLAECQKDGRETHNRFWISAALADQGHRISPDDWRVAAAVDQYFSAFLEYCHLIPGTASMLETLKKEYLLGLLTNFTHGPAARNILDHLGITPFFSIILISGELGYRKPHPYVFLKLIEEFGVETSRILYVGDDPEPDIKGARGVGLQPVWTTYVMDHQIPYARGILTGAPESPDPSVPRISAWQDLLALLNG
jgi:putative hydrolase of the HAD superfamily